MSVYIYIYIYIRQGRATELGRLLSEAGVGRPVVPREKGARGRGAGRVGTVRVRVLLSFRQPTSQKFATRVATVCLKRVVICLFQVNF